MKYLNKISYFLFFYIILFNLTMISKATDILAEDNRRLSFAAKVLSEEIVDKINQRGYLDPLFQYKRSCDFRPSLKVHLNYDELREGLVRFYARSENIKTLWNMAASIKPSDKLLNENNFFHGRILSRLYEFSSEFISQEIVDKLDQRGYLTPLFQYKESCDFRPSLKVHLNYDELREDLARFYELSENPKTLWNMAASIKPSDKVLYKDNPLHRGILKKLKEFKDKALIPGKLLLERDLIFLEPSPEGRRRITNPELSKAMWQLPDLKQIFLAQDDREA